MRFSFANIWILYLIWLVPLWSLLLHFLRKRQQEKRMHFTGSVLAGKLLPAENQRLLWFQELALAGALVLLLLAAAGPRSSRPEEQEVAMRGRDIVLLLDVSRSMLADDVRPSRLVRAKADMLDILDELRPGDRVAIVAFRYRATRITPFTSDQGFLRQAIAGVSIDSAPAGETDIGAGIRMALDIFDDDTPSHKAVILLSDGEDLAGEAISAAQDAARRNIPFFTVGIGSRSGSTIPDRDSPQGVFLFEGEPVITRLEDESLVTLARLTGGTYIPVETAGAGAITLGQRIREQLRAVEARTYTTMEASDYTERFSYFLLPAIVLLLIAGFLTQGPIRKHARIPHIAIIMLFFAGASFGDTMEDKSGQSHRAIARQAQHLQQQNQFTEAAQRYLQAADTPDIASRFRDRYRYNAAIASLQAGDPETAANLLEYLPPIQQANLARAIAAFEQGRIAADGSVEGYRERLAQWQEAAQRLQRHWQQTEEAASEEDLQKLDAMLPQAAREATLADILERYADKDPAQLAWDMLQKKRSQDDKWKSEEIPPIGPARLEHFQNRARERNELAEQYLALSHLLQSDGVSPDQFNRLLDEHQTLEEQVASLEDLHPLTDTSLAEIGHPLYDAWRERGSPESMLSESLRQQEWLNEIADYSATRKPPVPVAELQQEAADLTDLFAQRVQLPPETDSDTEEFIFQSIEEASRLQRLAAEMLRLGDQDGARPVQEEALEILREIFIPDPEGPYELPADDQDETPSDPPPPPEGEPDDEDPDLQLPPPPEPDDQMDDEEPEDDPDDLEPEDEEDDTFDVDAMLEQVEQRSQEYQELLDERRRRLQRQESARDW